MEEAVVTGFRIPFQRLPGKTKWNTKILGNDSRFSSQCMILHIWNRISDQLTAMFGYTVRLFADARL
jgi:hypothetical protein